MHKLLSFEINPSESFTLQRESGSPCDWDACLLCQAVDISSILLCDSLVRVSASLVGRLNPYISFCHLETLHFRTLITLDPNRTYPSRPHHLSARANYHFFVPSGSCHLKYISQRLEKKVGRLTHSLIHGCAALRVIRGGHARRHNHGSKSE